MWYEMRDYGQLIYVPTTLTSNRVFRRPRTQGRDLQYQRPVETSEMKHRDGIRILHRFRGARVLDSTRMTAKTVPQVRRSLPCFDREPCR